MEKLSILIVDDEALTRKSLIAGVNWEKLGIGKVYEAYSTDFARKIIASQKIDIALIDIEMPGETGPEFLSWLRNKAKSEIPCAFLTCHASFDYAKEAIRLNCFDYLLKPINYYEVEDLILRMCSRSRELVESGKREQYGKQWLYEKEQEGHKHEKEAGNTKEIVEEAATYIRSHLAEKLSLSELAYNAGLNPNYFNRIFKEITGSTVNKYIINERMKLAAHLLEEGNLKIYAIAEMVGYENYANFVNMFKKTYGVSPNVWQERKK